MQLIQRLLQQFSVSKDSSVQEAKISAWENLASFLEEGIVVLNGAHQILVANRPFCKMFGCVRDNIINNSFVSLKSNGQEGCVGAFPKEEIFQQCLYMLHKLEQGSWEIRETIHYKKDQDEGSVEVVAVKLDKGEVALMIKSHNPETQTLKIGKEFIANASHELRTPITIIKGFVETLQELPEVSDAMLEDIFDKILRSCKRMDDIVKNLLILTDLDHLMKPAAQVFDVLGLLEHCAQSLREIYPQVDLQLESAHGEEKIWADPALLELAVMNLLQNAVKYSPSPAKICISLESREEHVMLKVADRGFGIPKENLPNIFNRFYAVNKTLSRKLGGAGLGLSIVKAIIDKHQGQIHVESNPLGGTIFSITISKSPL